MENFSYPAIGTGVTMPALTDFGFEKGQTFAIIGHVVIIDEHGIRCTTDLLAIDGEANDLGKDVIKVNLDMWDYSVL